MSEQEPNVTSITPFLESASTSAPEPSDALWARCGWHDREVPVYLFSPGANRPDMSLVERLLWALTTAPGVAHVTALPSDQPSEVMAFCEVLVIQDDYSDVYQGFEPKKLLDIVTSVLGQYLSYVGTVKTL